MRISIFFEDPTFAYLEPNYLIFVMGGLDLSGSWARFTELHKELLEKYILVSKPCQGHGRNNPLIDQTCLDAIKVKHRKWTKYKHCKSQENFNNLRLLGTM